MLLVFTSNNRGFGIVHGAWQLSSCSLILQHSCWANSGLLIFVGKECLWMPIAHLFGLMSHFYIPEMPARMKIWKIQDNRFDCKSLLETRNLLFSLFKCHTFLKKKSLNTIRLGYAVSGCRIISTLNFFIILCWAEYLEGNRSHLSLNKLQRLMGYSHFQTCEKFYFVTAIPLQSTHWTLLSWLFDFWLWKCRLKMLLCLCWVFIDSSSSANLEKVAYCSRSKNWFRCSNSEDNSCIRFFTVSQF